MKGTWRAVGLCALHLAHLAIPAGSWAQEGVEPRTVSEWTADVRELVAHVEENHRNPYHTVSRADFEGAVDDLIARLPSLRPAGVVAELARLLALIGDGHTRLTLPVNQVNFGFELGHTPDPEPAPGTPRFHTLPVRFADFEEGVHIVYATADHADLIGARLTGLGDRSTTEALSGLEPFVAHDTAAGLRFHATKLLAIPELLVEAGISQSVASTELSVAMASGELRRVPLAPVAHDQTPEWVGESHLRRPDEPYFSIETDRPGALIVRILQINDSPGETIGAFSRRLSKEISRRDPDKVILDLRLCHGGDQSLSRALVLPLVRWQRAVSPGHLFALVGPETFSAAVNLASRLEEWTQVTFAGEPLGSGPSHYGSSDREVLDNSGLVVRVSTGYFVGWTGSEWRQSVEIGLPVKWRIADYLGGRDTVLETVLAHRPKETVNEQLVDAYERAGINEALILWSRYRTDPATSHLPLERAGNALARHLSEKGELAYSAAVYLYNREFHPDSVDAYLGEAEARHRLGEEERALAVLDESSARFPDDQRIEALRARITGGDPRP